MYSRGVEFDSPQAEFRPLACIRALALHIQAREIIVRDCGLHSAEVAHHVLASFSEEHERVDICLAAGTPNQLLVTKINHRDEGLKDKWRERGQQSPREEEVQE